MSTNLAQTITPKNVTSLNCLCCTVCYPGTTPNLPELILFTCANGKVLNIPLQIGTKFYQFGLLLLKDSNGTTVDNIIFKHNNDPVQINTEILKEWLNGSGKQPMTWEILIETLDDCNLVTLAKDIKAVK